LKLFPVQYHLSHSVRARVSTIESMKEWVDKRKGGFNDNERRKIIEKQRPNRIVIKHYRSITQGYQRGEEKILGLFISEIENDVSLNLVMCCRPNLVLSSDSVGKHSVKWGYLVVSLWEHFGITPDITLLKRIYPKEYLKRDNTHLFPFGLGMLGVLWLLSYILRGVSPIKMKTRALKANSKLCSLFI